MKSVCSLALLVLIVPRLADAGYGSPTPVVHVRSYASPSGKWTLEIDPSDRFGRGPGDYRMMKDNAEVWHDRLPFTLCEAAVLNDGVTVGYGYSHGVEGFGKGGFKDGPGTLNVVILGPQGELRLNEAMKRESTRVIHGLPEPRATGMLLFPSDDRFTVRFTAERGETWTSWKISTGEKLISFPLRPPSALKEKAHYVMGARPVLSTPLTLVQWWRYEKSKPGTAFTLHDLEGKVVWTLDLPEDYRVAGDEQAEMRLRNEIQAATAILDVSQPRSFVLRFVAAGERVQFDVQRNGDAWDIAESARVKYAVPEPVPAPSAPPLPLLGSFVLGEERSAGPLRDIHEFAFDSRGHIGFLREGEGSAPAFVIVDQDGHVLNDVPLPTMSNSAKHLTWIKGQRWLVVASPYGTDAKARAWWFDTDAGAFTEIARFDCFAIEKLCSSGDGGFVALINRHQQYTIKHLLIRFDAAGKVQWQNEAQSDGKPSSLFSPSDITVTTRGEIAVLDVIGHTVQLFDQKSVYLRTIQLQTAWKRTPNYPAGIITDSDGGFIVHDFNGNPPFIRMTADGTVRSEFMPKQADGRAYDSHDRIRMAPDGKLWASDRQSLVQLSDHGDVSRTLGSAVDEVKLGEVAGVTVDHNGRVYVADERTGAVHVFGPDGSKLHVCKPAKDDFKSALSLPHIAVADDGSVLLSLEKFNGAPRYLHFAPDGTRTGVKKLGFDSITEKWYPRPGSQNVLVIGYHSAAIYDGNGKAIRRIERQPDRRWLDSPHDAAFARDGSFAIQSHTIDRGKWERTVTFFTDDGTPVSKFVFEAGGFPSLSGYNGRLVALQCDHDISVYDRKGVKLGSAPASTSHRYHFITCNGTELWVIEPKLLKVNRFGLPR